MYLTLPESSRRRQRSAGGTAMSAVLHAAVIGVTVVGTGISAPRPTRPTPPEDIIFVVKPPAEDPSRPTPTPPPERTPPPPDTPPLVPPVLDPSPLVTVDPTVVPTTLPDLDAGLGAVPEPPKVANGGTGDGGTSTGTDIAPTDGAPMSALAVDRAVVVRDGAAPRYPAMLVSAGIEGVVLARFVVDTLGRVERAGIELTSSAHPMFAQSVREALGRMRFVPAESQGRKVRQLVQQPFTFEITRR